LEIGESGTDLGGAVAVVFEQSGVIRSSQDRRARAHDAQHAVRAGTRREVGQPSEGPTGLGLIGKVLLPGLKARRGTTALEFSPTLADAFPAVEPSSLGGRPFVGFGPLAHFVVT
jgi:hypothetical protein